MSKITLLGGSLGAGKTTLLTNLIQNNSFSNLNYGIVVMDAAGQIDYDRVSYLAENKKIPIYNATSACTVCDGPNAVFKRIQDLKDKGIENILIELSGQMPLSTMQSKMSQKGIEDTRSIYLLDPKTLKFLSAAEEIAFTDTLGITKSKLTQEEEIISLNQDLNIVEIPFKNSFKLEDLFKEKSSKTQPTPRSMFNSFTVFGVNKKHSHSNDSFSVNKYHTKIQNPYIQENDFSNLIEKIASKYQRVKGYFALDSEHILQFDSVCGETSFRKEKNSLVGNGMILVANESETFFDIKKAEDDLSILITKPYTPAILRKGSSQNIFQQYISQALISEEYDSALGAAEQFKFETGDNSLILETIDSFTKGKLKLIKSESISPAQKALQLGSLIYSVKEHNSKIENLYELESLFSNLFNTNKDEIRSLTDEETFEFFMQMSNNK